MILFISIDFFRVEKHYNFRKKILETVGDALSLKSSPVYVLAIKRKIINILMHVILFVI
jgi:hypothetical protein